jgi:hypothetical protein
LSLFGPNIPNIRRHFLPIQQLSTVEYRSNEVVLEARFSEVIASPAGFCYLVCKHSGGRLELALV